MLGCKVAEDYAENNSYRSFSEDFACSWHACSPLLWKDHLVGPFAGRGFGGGYDEAIADDTALALDDYVALLATEDVAAHSSFCW